MGYAERAAPRIKCWGVLLVSACATANIFTNQEDSLVELHFGGKSLIDRVFHIE
jgi:hypothetical protein